MGRKKQPDYPTAAALNKPATSTRKSPVQRKATDDTQEQILLLPPPHSKPQNNLINAWDLRYDPNDPAFSPADPLNTSFYDPAHPRWADLPLTFPKLRFVVGACGTKFGKTYGCAIRLVKEAWDNPTMTERNWWVAPTYAQAENAMQFVMTLLPHGTYRPITSQGKMRIILLNEDGSDRAMMEFKSGDDPASLRGYAVRFFVFDECAQGMPEASYISVLTTTTQTEGRGIFISTPNGDGWFKEIYDRGVKYHKNGVYKYNDERPDPWPEWFSVRMPTHVNPHVKLKEVELKRRQMIDVLFRQEYLAEFAGGANKVFKEDDVQALFQAAATIYTEGQQGAFYVVGVDLGDKRDWTVITVMDRYTKQVVYCERFQKRGWQYAKKQIIRVLTAFSKFNSAYVIMDSTGVGDPIFDDLVDAGYKIHPYSISGNDAKRKLIEKLGVAIEQKSLSIPNPTRKYPDFGVYDEELTAFEYHYNKDGRGPVLQYEAPSGKHDDAVISLAFCTWIADTPRHVYRYRKQRGI